MSLTPSTMLDLGVEVPAFTLPDVVNDRDVSLDDFNSKEGTVIIFMCNHCPYVKHIKEDLVTLANDYEDRVGMVAISSNDIERYPKDRPELMAEDAEHFGYPFPYLYDESQDAAKAYRAACTPDIYLIDGDRKLIYRGQFDDSRPANGKPVTGSDLREAIDRMLEGNPQVEEQKPSMGCNIKWKPGNEPDYFG